MFAAIARDRARPPSHLINLQRKLILATQSGTEGVMPVAEALGVPPGADISFTWALPPERFDEACWRGTV
jgi:hypothetical protein